MSLPDEILSTTDPGDDMQRRVRYQAAYSALICVDLLVNGNIDSLLCEQHEDLLIKNVNFRYVGVQVKTRDISHGPFKSNDEAMVKSLIRFVNLNKDFPGCFEKFIIVANCDFWKAADNETNLPFMLNRVRSNASATFNGTMKKVIDDIKGECNCSKKDVIEVLAITHLDGSVPKYEDITVNIASRIGNLPQYKHHLLNELCSAAEALINQTLKASALTCDQPARTHFIYAANPVELKTKATIDAKRITRDSVSTLLNSSLTTPTTLKPLISKNLAELPSGHHLLEKKMAAGDISFDNISLAKDHQTSAEYLLQQWLHEVGSSLASDRYNQVDLAVRTRCAEAHDDAFSETTLFGQAMLADVRKKMATLEQDTDLTFGAKYEHLLGFASLATQACAVWWSKHFDVKGDA